MEEAPDMDDLLDEMEADAARKRPEDQIVPVCLPNVGLKMRKFLPNSSFGDRKIEGSVTIDLGEIPETKMPLCVSGSVEFNEKCVDRPEASKEAPKAETRVSEPKEKFPDSKELKNSEKDSEMEEMLEYLNGFEDKSLEEGSSVQEGVSDGREGLEEATNATEKAAEQIADNIMESVSKELLSSTSDEYSETLDVFVRDFKNPESLEKRFFEIEKENDAGIKAEIESDEVIFIEKQDEAENQAGSENREKNQVIENLEDENEGEVDNNKENEEIEAKKSQAENGESLKDEAAKSDFQELEAENEAEAQERSENIEEIPRSPSPKTQIISELEEDEITTSDSVITVIEAEIIGKNPENSESSPEKLNTSSETEIENPDIEPREDVEFQENVEEDAENGVFEKEQENREIGAKESHSKASAEQENTQEVEICQEIVREGISAEIDENEGAMIAVEVASSPQPMDSSEIEVAFVENVEEEVEEQRPRFDSVIATVHVLNESDSDEPTTPRERRLTQSELQLGKTCPYWIPDSDCPLCMLCNAKFTLLTRRHHCRACGRVLCANCCNNKAILEYLQEPAKKPSPVRVCTPCSTMLARIEAYEQWEASSREGGSSGEGGGPAEDGEGASGGGGGQQPKGVLKRAVSQSEGEDVVLGVSSSSQSVGGGSSIEAGTSTRRSVMFRDGVRPGAPADEQNPAEERSTALKPKKKSRKRTAVVKRCAELRLEEELACALPNAERQNLLIYTASSEEEHENSTTFQKPSAVFEKLKNRSIVTIVLKKSLYCNVQIVDDAENNFGPIWCVSTIGFSQIGLDELYFSWTMNEEEKRRIEVAENIGDFAESVILEWLPLPVLHRISMIYVHSTDAEKAGVSRVDSRFPRLHSVPITVYPLPKHIMLFRPSLQDFSKVPHPENPFLVACFLNEDELQWATACPDRLMNRIGLEYGCYPTPITNKIGRASVYSTETSGTVLKVFTDFRSWSYRMRHIAGCTVSLTNEKTTIRVPRSSLAELREVISWNRSMLSWRCDLSTKDDSLLICDETEPGFYNTQVFARYAGKRESTSASFVILDGGSKVNSLQVNVVEDGVSIRVQSERLEVILNEMQGGNNIVERTPEMEFRVEFFDDSFVDLNEYLPKSQIDGRALMNKYQYGLSLDRALTQVFQLSTITDYVIRMSHVYNMRDGRLTPEEEPKIYGLTEVAARECCAMLEPYLKNLIAMNIESVSIRLLVTSDQIEYDVSPWIGLEEENSKFKQSLDQLIPLLFNMMEIVPNGFEVEMVLSIVSTRPIPI